MQRSEQRILTTHAGSLPRPAALTRLFAQRVNGEAVDAKEIEAQGRAAIRAIVAKQIETGLDVIDDGEQSRESFVLYMRHRLTGLGGVGSRPMHADLDAYPQYKSAFQQPRDLRRQGVQPHASAEGDRRDRLRRSVADRGRMRRLPRRARRGRRARTPKSFLTAPSPGIIASIVQNEHYDSFERYLDALAAALQVEYEAIVRNGFLLQLDCPDLALERHTSYRDRPLADFVALRRAGRRGDQQGGGEHPARKNPPACVLGQLRGPARPGRGAARHSPGDPAGEGRRDLPAVRQSAPRARIPRAGGRSRSPTIS